MDELFAEMDAIRWKRRQERLLQFSAVKTNTRHIREIGGQTRERAGKSHSCETPTSWSARPSAYAISVAAGRKETMRRLFMGLVQSVSGIPKLSVFPARRR